MLETLITALFGSFVAGSASTVGYVLIAGAAYFVYQRFTGGAASLTDLIARVDKFGGYARDWGVYDLFADVFSSVKSKNFAKIPGDFAKVFQKFDTPEERRKIADDLARAQLKLILANPERKAALEKELKITITANATA